MISLKGQCSAKVFMRNKPTRCGIKNYILCGESGLMYDFILYQGGTTIIKVEYNSFGHCNAAKWQKNNHH